MTDKDPIIFNIASEGDIQYWMHYMDHMDLDSRQRQAARHLRDSFYRLLRYRDRVDEVRSSFSRDAFSGERRATAKQQGAFYDASVDYFQTFYLTISAFASFLTRVSSGLGVDPPSANSVSKLIKWMSRKQKGIPPIRGKAAQELEKARAFRALIDHPAGTQPYDWLVDHNRDGFAELLVIFGPRGKAVAPTGATDNAGPLGNDGWAFTAPDEVSATNALLNSVTHYIPFMAGTLEFGDHEGVTCPDFYWERDWNGDRPVYSEPFSVYQPEAGLRRLDTGELLRNRELTKREARNEDKKEFTHHASASRSQE